MSDGNSGHKWLAVAAAAGLTVGAGYVIYKYVLTGDEEVEEEKAVLEAKPLVDKSEVKSGSQFAFPTASSSTPPSVIIKEHKPSSSTKICGHCNKKLTGLPLRCSQCKAAYYCSNACQKQAWPTHKTSCKASGAPAAEPKKEATPEAAAPAVPAEAAVTSSQDTLQSVLADILAEQAQARGGSIEGELETAVLHFVKGDLRAALAGFEVLRTRAAAEGRPELEAESFKWRGHCHTRLKDTASAERAFAEGVAFCGAQGFLRLQVDCQQGLGCLLRNIGQPAKAVDALKKALEFADKTDDDDCKASSLCNLGAALMQTPEAAEGLVCLQAAVKLRSDKVEKLLELPEEVAEATRGALGQAILEHATALVNLAGALFSTGKFSQARAAYEQALAIFEMVGDTDKVTKVLVNLANMVELQLQKPEEAAHYRRKLLEFLGEMGQRKPESTCAICMEPMSLERPAQGEAERVLLLACLHPQHDACFQKWCKKAEEESRAPCCPTCREPVTMVE